MLVPGFIFSRVLNFKNLQQLEVILFSVGLGIAFLMVAGLFINEFGLMIGISSPLSEIPLIVVLNSVLLLFCLFSSRSDQYPKFQIVEVARLIVKTPSAFLFLCLPLLSVVGSIWNNTYANNSILLFMIVAIALLFAIAFLSKKLFPPKLYPLAVLMIAISLLFHRSLVSNYVQCAGSDIHGEFALFKFTENNGFWSGGIGQLSNVAFSVLTSRFNDMLSITVLPTILSTLMNLDPAWIMKILFPLFFSFVPLALYRLWETQFGAKLALISAFFFMAEQTFYTEMLGLARQMVAELFFSLLFIVILWKETKSKKILCFTIFSAALIMSHYALSLIFLFFLLPPLIFPFLMRRWRAYSAKITLTMITLFSVLMFSWYIYTSNSATFDSMLQFANYVFGQMGEWANPASRGTTVLRGLGLEASPSIWNSISRGFAYFVQFLIILGFVGLITRRTETSHDREYFYFVLPSIALLGALVLVPGLAETLNMTRFYHILLFFLAPLCALGAGFLAKIAFKQKAKLAGSILLLAVLIPYFLFQTNFVYEVVGSESWSLPLSRYRWSGLKLYGSYYYVDGASIFGGQWLSENANSQYTKIYGDVQSLGSPLTYCGVTLEYHIETLSNATVVQTNGMVYLDTLNIAYGIVIGENYQWNSSELSFLNNLDLIYSNGACEIYKKP